MTAKIFLGSKWNQTWNNQIKFDVVKSIINSLVGWITWTLNVLSFVCRYYDRKESQAEEIAWDKRWAIWRGGRRNHWWGWHWILEHVK